MKNKEYYDKLASKIVWRDGSPYRYLKTSDTYKKCGWVDKGGYLRITIGDRDIMAHRLLWYMENGDIPDGYQIDHIDGNPLNNIIENLRLVTCSQNNKNKGKYKGREKGIWQFKKEGKWYARIGVNGKYIHLGSFDSKVEALKARTDAEIKYFGEFRRK
ncbi:MAG: HNH endonuclease [Pseudoalteromonas sp.]|uniref:HNH endonuclease n=1 Tax=Pseudoalteromonas sp. TaxID=53249 RepID=UPI001D64C84C|nr:HNH endonuclease [Pseudoalteromonas sp.]NQY00576.1 HNH endonuclease [Flavobacteriaceae bacterium]NRA82071.1 HNH endonuclease [Pseudoalteromonas sp.]